MINKSVRNDLITSNNIWKVATSQRDDYTTACLLDYIYFKNYYKMRATDLRKKTKTWCWSKGNTTNQEKLNAL